MARFILKWRYIKSGSPKHGENLVKYIATREGVEKCDESWKHQPAIKELINDFPDSAQSFEYQDYIAAQTKSTASEFISRTIEDNVDLIGKKENYVGYIAMRPRVEKQGSHGLFTQRDQEIDLPLFPKRSQSMKAQSGQLSCRYAEKMPRNLVTITQRHGEICSVVRRTSLPKQWEFLLVTCDGMPPFIMKVTIPIFILSHIP